MLPPSAEAVVPPTTAPPTEIPQTYPPLDRSWGTADPVTLVAAAPNRRWVAVCQARRDTNGDGKVSVDVGPQGEVRGDRLAGYFVDVPGAGFEVDAFGGSDPSGRFVAFVRGGRLLLHDTTTQVDVDLSAAGADLRDDLGSFLHPRGVAFDPTGRRMLYLRGANGKTVVVVRELGTGSETVVDPGDGELWRADFDDSGGWVIVRVVAADTNQNGKLDWTVREAPGPYMRCTAPVPRYSVWERPGDSPAVRVARAGVSGTAIDAPGLVTPFGDALVERDADGALILARANGEKTTLTKKSCESRLLHADAAREALVVTCLAKNGRADVDLLRRGSVKSLGIEMAGSGGDHAFSGSPRFAPLQPGNDAVLLDVDTGDIERLSTGDRIIAVAGSNALVLRGKTLILHEHGAADRALDGEILPLAHWVHSGSVYVAPPFVVDVARGVLLGRTDVTPLAVADDGAVLATEGRAADATHFAVGPLRWHGTGS